MQTISAQIANGKAESPAVDGGNRGREGGQLVVIIPDIAAPAQMASRIQDVAAVRRQSVLIVGVASQFVTEAELRRKLVQLVGFLNAAGTSTRLRMERDLHWIESFRGSIAEDDLVACCVNEGLRAAGDDWIDLLAGKFPGSIHVFMDFNPDASRAPGLIAQLAPWLTSLIVILAFFGLQVWLSRPGSAPANGVLLFASLPVEIGLIWLVNSFLG